ncbi:uncharacterized protein LOC124292329 isoform X4 [Haliotis rubra]|uniref:uncharacterized protein LOC124292329 isoform X4 n=1 Tax=Haliotis rubra TaxID=36100 RepID=UPI001EE5CEFB|nr:uncharacterized protein LOC124292329 isoform X4 [Haliotis rubra]
MRSAVYLLVIIQAASGTAAQGPGSSCHYKNGCSPSSPDVCSVPPPACHTDWSGTFCQIHNIAHGKPASQSSTWTDNTGTYNASRAVDGNVSTDWNSGSCSHTDEQGGGNANWHIFLGGTYLISRITIYLRSNAIDKYQAMEVLVNNRTCRKLPVTDIRDSLAHLISNPVTLSCIQPIEGDTVTIEMAGPWLALCEVQVFGEKKVSCHCSNGCSDFPNTPCSAPSTGPVCIPPWFGSFCQMENIAFQRTATQSCSYSGGGIPYCAAYAVDGNTDTDFSHRSCSNTNNAGASWQVLLDDHQMFNISSIRIYLRSDLWDRNDGLQVLVNGDPCVPVSGTPDWLHGPVTNPVDVTCTHVMKGNNVTITRSGTFLALCEVQVFICGDGWFGENCERQCQCLNTSEVCDKETGYCRSGCAAGKQGQGCQNPVCNDRFFGSNCSQQCQCLDLSEVCDKETGYCRSGCAAGKQGPGCQQHCDHGHYGVSCSYTCGQCTGSSDCQKVNGTCTQGCQQGYSPPLCKVCSDGWFGTNCSEQCKCQNETEVCDKTTGNCTSGCRAGKTGVGCQDDCDQGQYGINCSSTCGQCSGSPDCDKDDGNCTQGCQTGYLLPLCKDCVEGRYGVNCSQQCGSCKDGSPCNTTSGVCELGCADNFEEPHCEFCNDWWFGNNCSEQCKCQNETEVCDKTTGNCTSGCRAGKTGVGCQDDCVQGQYGINCSSTCGQCSGSSDCKKDDGHCTQGCQTGYPPPLCKDCVEGRYGVNCSQQCGSCKDDSPCNTTTGVCVLGCADNFEEPYCELCSDRWFGTNCSEQCRCQNTTEVCNKTTGNCTSGCRAGKTGVRCQDDCGQGQYGINCSSTCGLCSGSSDCNKDDGHCTLGCQQGYSSPLCKECVQGSYGTNCTSLCGHCKDGQTCNSMTGHCQNGCQVGYEKPFCSQGCFNKTYGQDCSSSCGRCLNWTCSNTDGTCVHGCEPGFEGDLCVTESQTGNKEGGAQSLTGLIVGVVVGVLSAAVVVAVLVYIRRRRSLQKSHTEDQPEEDTTESSFSAVSSDRTASPSSKSAKPVKPSKKPRSPANHVYENSDTLYNVSPTPVPLERLRQYIGQRVGGAGFEQEYKLLRHGLAKEHKEGLKPENKKRNRFLALFPYDESRVVLAPDGDATCDYIHASYVQGFHEEKVFIAAQGPNSVTVNDFWRMIWQENVSQIVMLTRVMEVNRKKCEQYWPDGTRDKKCGNIVIKPLLSTVRADFTIRKFLVQHSKTPSDKRTVTQLHFTSWPDHDVPSAPALVGFWKQYRSLTSSEEDITGPVVIHCSAGVGRTGTFIALDNLFDEAESLNKVNVFACVSKLREARVNMVQTVEQYRFVHESVMEAIDSRGTFFTLSDFEGKFGTGLKYSRQQDIEMNRQFQSLESVKMEIPEKLVSDAYLPANVGKNRNKNIVPANRGRPFLSTPVADHNDYINAVILPSATQPLGLIATQTPLKDTVVDFWRLVFDHDCFTIVCLEDEGENQAIYPRKNESLNIGPFRLTTLKEDTSRDSFTEMELNLALREQDNTLHQIRVFKVRSQIPGPTEPMLEFVNEIGRKGSSEEHNTLVHCLDGARLCGVFCSVLNIMSRLRLDKEVDIYLTIRELQCIRPQFIQSYDQYKFCYDLVKEYLRDTCMYANM